MRTYYWSAIVSMVLSCTIFELFDVERMYYVSDTIRKPPLVEAQTASGKQKKIRSVERGYAYLSNYRNFTKIGDNRL